MILNLNVSADGYKIRTNQKWQRQEPIRSGRGTFGVFFISRRWMAIMDIWLQKDVTILVQYRLYTAFTEVGALFLLGKDRIILILAPDLSQNKAPSPVYKGAQGRKLTWRTCITG